MSIRIPLFFGTLKIKTRDRLRREEALRKLPILRVGSLFVVWARRRREG